MSCRSSIIVLFAIALLVLPAAAQEKPATLPKVLSSIQGMKVTDEEVNRAAAADLDKLQAQKLQFEANYERNLHQALENALQRVVEDKLVAAEAAKQGITSAELLAREVDKNVHEPTDQEVLAFYEANKSRITMPKEQAIVQIKPYLKRENLTKTRNEYVEKLKKEAGVSYTIEPLRTKIDTAGFPSLGPAAAPVTIVEFSDFQCTFCKAVHSTIEQVVKDFSPDVRLVYRQFPLSDLHPMAEKAAEASLCAAEQDKFWQLHDLMFDEQGSLAVPDLKTKAAKLGLNSAAFDTCLDSGRYAAKIKLDLNEGARVGISGTPALFINGRFYSGARPYEEIAAVVKDELQRKKSSN